MGSPVCVIVYLLSPNEDRAVIEDAYRRTSWLNDPPEGLRRCELLHDTAEPHRFALLSEWDSLAAYQAWEQGPDHQGKPSPLRPYQDRTRGPHYVVYQQLT
jgi:heme-degrading monooxygenase HmoA